MKKENFYGINLNKIFNSKYIFKWKFFLLIIFLILFLRLNPLLNSLILALILFVFRPIIFNYINKFLFDIDNVFHIGTKIKLNEDEAILSKKSLQGLYFTTPNGSKYISYTDFFKSKYYILEEINDNFHEIIAKIPEKRIDSIKNPIDLIESKLFDCPYLNWDFKPQITFLNNNYLIRFSVTESKYLNPIIETIKVLGFECTLKI